MDFIEIEKLANEIEDVSDPSSFEKVNMYYDELQIEASEYIQLLISKLESAYITWEQPWYQSVSCGLTAEHQPLIERNKIETEKFRTDKITKEEHDKINKNWTKFTKKYGVPDKMRFFVSWKNQGNRKGVKSPEEHVRRFVAAYLSRGLERTIHQVYHYVKYFHMRELDRKIYSKHEEKIMEVCFMHSLSNAPVMLPVLLGRHSRGIYKRCAIAKTGGKIINKKHKWTLQEASKLVKLMLEQANVPLHEFKDMKLEKPFWSKLETEMNRHYSYLHHFWYAYLYPQLFVQCDVKLYKLRRKIFKMLHDSPYRIWADIKWDEILKSFPSGLTRHFLHKICGSIARKNKKYLTMPLKELAEYCLQKMKTKNTNKRLKRLTLDGKGNLVKVDQVAITDQPEVPIDTHKIKHDEDVKLKQAVPKDKMDLDDEAACDEPKDTIDMNDEELTDESNDTMDE